MEVPLIEQLMLFMQPQGSNGGSGMMSTVIMFGLIFVIFYFLIIRPQQRRQKERDKMLGALQKGDKVVTSGGLRGTIAGIEEKTILLEIASGVKVKVDRGSIGQIVRESAQTS
jgi:preprotein translocase subunit YajC